MNPGATAPPPATCGVAFKEWARVCEALASGRQSLILRKGGVEEGPGGFAPEHPVFWLYPTRVHQAEQGLKADARPAGGGSPAPAPGDTIGLPGLAVVGVVGRVEREGDLEALDGLHVWTAETVGKRFHYRSPGLWVLGVRVYRAEPPAVVPVTEAHAGCKTWVPLEVAPGTGGLAPALGETEFGSRMRRLRSILGAEATPR